MARSEDATYLDLIARNRRNSVILVAGFIAVVGVTVGVIAAAMVGGDTTTSLWVGYVAVAAASLVAIWSYYKGGDAILALSRAKPIEKNEDPELYNVVEEMAIAGGVPTPPVYLIDDTALNAFATGRDPEHAAIAITRGLRDTLTRDELQAVVAHEMSHVRNHDIRLAMLLATLVGLVVLISDFFIRTMGWRMWFGGGRGRSRRGSAGGSLGIVLLVVAVLLAIVSPLLVRVIQLAASREREYLADAGAVELTRNPSALVSALQKLGDDREVLEVANRATAHLYVVPPIKRWEDRAKGMFATHPPLSERIERIDALVH